MDIRQEIIINVYQIWNANKQYKSKDIILIGCKSIGTLGIYLQNRMVFMNDFLSIYSTSIQVSYLFHDLNHERIG